MSPIITERKTMKNTKEIKTVSLIVASLLGASFASVSSYGSQKSGAHIKKSPALKPVAKKSPASKPVAKKSLTSKPGAHSNDQKGESSDPRKITLKDIYLFVDASNDKFVFVDSSGKPIYSKALQENLYLNGVNVICCLVIYFKNS
jgi:hypothetical protein